MSLVVQVRLFFSEAALREAMKVLRDHRALASQRMGFVSLRCLKPAGAERCNDRVLVLEFQSEAQLQVWRASGEHSRIAQEYKRLSSPAPEVEFFEVEE